MPSASYRDDRYIRSRPFGDCGAEAKVQCHTGGDGFYVCSQGGLIDMGAVAAGTTCADGVIAASS